MRQNTAQALMVMTTALLVACNDSGSSTFSNGDDGNGNGSGNGNGDTGDVAVSCEANLNLADNDEGLSRDGHSGLSFFAVQDRVCALDAEQGTVFEVDRSDSGDNVQQMDTHFSTDASGDLTIEGVVYAMDDHLLWADADASAGGVTPRQISSEDRMEDVMGLRVESDFENPDNALVIYRIEGEGWYAVPVDAGTSQDPVALEMAGSTSVSVVAVRDTANSGALQGLLIPQATEFEDFNGEEVPAEYNIIYKTIGDLDGPGEALLNDQSSLGFAKLGQLDNGDMLLWSNFGLHAFNLSSEELTAPNEEVDVLDDGIISLGLSVRYANYGESLYLADDGSDGPRLTRLYIEDGDPEYEILRNDIEDARGDVPRFVTTTDNHVVWGYRADRDIDGEEEIIDVVESVELDGSNPTQYDMDVGLALRDQITDTLTPPQVYSTGDKVFFNVTPRFIDQGITVFRAYWLEPDADSDALNYRENQNWRLALSDPSILPASGLAQQERAEILVVGRDENVDDSEVLDIATALPASEPDADGVELGEYGADGGPIGPFGLSTADYGIGPGRLATRGLTSGENTLYWLDVRHEGSMTPILRNNEGQPYGLQPGF